MAVRGHVDGMAGSYVKGWAFGDAEVGHCMIQILDAEGQTMAAGVADQARPDLGGSKFGRVDLGFRIAVRNPAARRVLRVLADGVELGGSPITTGERNFDNSCAMVGATISGFVTERITDFAAPVIQAVNQHGRVVAEVRSVQAADEPDPMFRPARFTMELDDGCFGCGELRLRLLANGVKFAERSCDLRLESHLDTLTDETYSGWLVAPEVPERVFGFEVFQDGVLAGSVKCAVARDDVRDLYPGVATPGFAVTFRKPAHSVVDATAVSFRFAGSDLDLFKGPYVVGSRPAAVAAAQRAAQAANRGFELGVAERAVVQVALRDFMDAARRGNGFVAARQQALLGTGAATGAGAEVVARPRLTVLIPVYKDVAVTRACVQSVLAHRIPATDHVVLINDAAPEPEMAPMLNGFGGQLNVFVLVNRSNLGFVKAVNRGLSFALGGDVVLLNSDTVVFAGGLEEMARVAAGPGVGTVTALSNNATIFSYPHVDLRVENLGDVGWGELAAVALAENGGVAIDVPTGHGFCLLIKGEVLRRLGGLDEGFGRGYGEENDFCLRAANLGYRNVVAPGALVVHREGVSFAAERDGLMARNLPKLEAAYPEYTPVVRRFEEQDGLRRGRWALDKARLRRAVARGQAFGLLVTNALEGGTAKAIEEIEAAQGGDEARLTLRCTEAGMVELEGVAPLLRASFAADEMAALFEVLEAAAVRRVAVHQLLGFPAGFVERMGVWARGRPSVFYAHDFYPMCPRVTMVDASWQFCDIAVAQTCVRCVKLGGAHPLSNLNDLTPAAHRALFAAALAGFGEVVAPSANAVWYMGRAFPALVLRAKPHPEVAVDVAAARQGGDDEIVLLGAIGAHKGSSKLLELAARARLSHPGLTFRVIGYTDVDAALLALGNVTITGKYTAAALPGLVAAARGRLALFLQLWPETYSYTLSEAARFGFVPMVPDIGAPAERVRAAGFGVVYPFPVNVTQVLEVIDAVAAGTVTVSADGATPAGLFPDREINQKARNVLKNDQEVVKDGVTVVKF